MVRSDELVEQAGVTSAAREAQGLSSEAVWGDRSRSGDGPAAPDFRIPTGIPSIRMMLNGIMCKLGTWRPGG
ncbi:hypothetical protein ACWCP6_33660 [Streptomyces sp. NPDC002004]